MSANEGAVYILYRLALYIVRLIISINLFCLMFFLFNSYTNITKPAKM